MNHITQCLHCHTQFKVTDQQLDAAKGFVKCGRCGFIFNARESLKQAALAQQKAATHESVSGHDAASNDLVTASNNQIQANSFELKYPPLEETLEKIGVTPQGTAQVAPQVEPPSTPSSIDNQPAQTPLDKASSPQTNTKKPVINTQEDAQKLTTSSKVISAVDELLAPKPVAGATKRKKQSRPLPRPLFYLMTVLTVMGLISLAGMMIYINRTTIASEAPETRPLLESACQLLECDVPLPSNAALVRTEWSELSNVPDHPQLFLLNVTVKNLARYPVALPSMFFSLEKDKKVISSQVWPAHAIFPKNIVEKKALARGQEVKLTLQIHTATAFVHPRALSHSIQWLYPEN